MRDTILQDREYQDNILQDRDMLEIMDLEESGDNATNQNLTNSVQLRPARESEHFRTSLISDWKLWKDQRLNTQAMRERERENR